MHLKSSSQWALLVGKLRLSLFQLDSAPSQVGARPESPKPRAPSLTSYEIQCFMNATDALATPEECDRILKIVCAMQPQAVLSGAQSMSYQILNEPTLVRLRDYVRQCLNRRGLAWPQ
jgi:hypothetical protein